LNDYYSELQYNRKKQRRQVAAGVVQSVLGGTSNPTNSSGRKSTAQPRPEIVIPPGGIGPIANPNESDVLCGRGGRINSHVGNRQFREVILSRKKEYLAKTTKKLEKAHIAAAIVNDIRSMQPPGRFLKEDVKSGMWYDIGDAKAFKKTGQALREDAQESQPEIDTGKTTSNDMSATPDKSPKSPNGGSSSKPKKPKSPVPKTVHASSTPSQSNNGGSFDTHGPQLLPDGRANTVDQQGRAAMPPPFQYNQQANPYLTVEGGQMPMQSSFEARSIPIQAPQNVQGGYIPGGLGTGGSHPASASIHVQQALSHPAYLARQEESAFGLTFHPPASAIGSERTCSTISGLSDPVPSTMSGSGMNGSTLSNRSPTRIPVARGNSRVGPGPGGFTPNLNDCVNSGRFSEMSSYMQMSLGGGDMSMAGSLTRSSSFPDVSSILDSDSWNKAVAMGDSESDLAQLRSVLSAGTSKGSQYGTGASMMSVNSGTSSGQWMMNDGRSMLSDMSSDMTALDLAR